MTLEDLTQEELAWLLRENVTELDELKLINDALIRRQTKAVKGLKAAGEAVKLFSEKKRAFLKPYETGGKYRIPGDMQQKYREIEREGERLNREWWQYSSDMDTVSKELEENFKARTAGCLRGLGKPVDW